MTAAQLIQATDLQDSAEQLRRIERKLRRLGLVAIAVRIGGCAQSVELRMQEAQQEGGAR